jgi:uncharacterized repeat protein (TIGR03803 family)
MNPINAARPWALGLRHFMKTRKRLFTGWLVLVAGLVLAPAGRAQFTNYQSLKSFGFIDQQGQSPSGVVEGKDGVFYGTTSSGGGAGTVFRVNKDGSDYAVLRSISSAGGDGQYPRAAVVEGSDGALYAHDFRDFRL